MGRLGRATTLLAVLGLGTVLVLNADGVATATESTLELKWHQLVPPAPPKPAKPFFGSRPVDIGQAPDDGAAPPPPRPEGAWMSAPTKREGPPAPVVESLDGKRVHIGGYVVPLDFEATRVKEFLLVPFVGACIHVPPPPANQIIYVKVAQGFEVQGSFDPVWVTGRLNVSQTFTGLAEAGYNLDAEKVELRAKE
jgi:uncharacterized protein